jgi:hypothetical protein
MSLYVPYYRPYNKHNTNIYAPGGIRTQDPSKRAAEDPDRAATGIGDSIPGPSSPYRIAIPTELSRPTRLVKHSDIIFGRFFNCLVNSLEW